MTHVHRQEVLTGNGPQTPREGATGPHPHRMLFVVSESVVAVGAVAGAWQLVTGTLTPPVSDLARLGLSNWVLPGLWLFTMVAIPAASSAWLAWRRSPLALTAVLCASGLLLVELVVQIPFVGPNMLQAVFGAVAVGLAAVAIQSRRLGWRRDRHG